jgi:hypothetical protein
MYGRLKRTNRESYESHESSRHRLVEFYLVPSIFRSGTSKHNVTQFQEAMKRKSRHQGAGILNDVMQAVVLESDVIAPTN